MGEVTMTVNELIKKLSSLSEEQKRLEVRFWLSHPGGGSSYTYASAYGISNVVEYRGAIHLMDQEPYTYC
jgi:hypothetical protein